MTESRKICTKCKKNKPINNFNIDNNISDNHSIYCKFCISIFNKKRVGKYKEYNKIRYKNNKSKILKINKEEYKKNSIKIRKRHRKNEVKRRESWRSILPNIIKCKICDKILYFYKNENNADASFSVVFDHRHGGKAPITRHPSNWLNSNNRTKEKEKVWKQSNFGTLCRKCNMFLPTNTKKRKKIVTKIVKYVFGKDFKIQKTYKKNK